MRVKLLACFLISLGSTTAQCSWTSGVTSQNNSFTITCADTVLMMQASHNCTNAVSYQWNGPGTSANTSTCNINQPGSYTLNVTDLVTACTNTQIFSVSVNTISPTFSVSPTSQTITCQTGLFTCTATAGIPSNNLSWSWYSPISPPPGPPASMSSGTMSLFSGGTAGTHTIELTNLTNGCSSLQTLTISSIIGFPTFSVTAAHGFQLGCWPADTMYITNVVLTNTNATFSYSFMPPGNNGSIPLANLLSGPNPSLITSMPGTYTVVVQDDANFCRHAIPVYILPSNTLNIGYTYTVGSNGVVNYSNTSIGTTSNSGYLWDYGDGTTGTGLNPSHTYSNGGVHHVILHTTNPSCVSASYPVNVNTIPCVANSNYSLTYSGTPHLWYAVPAYYGNVTNAIWNWGDGSSTNAMFPSHTYAAAGSYVICLTVTVSCGSTSFTCTSQNIYKVSSNQQMTSVKVVNELPVGISENTFNNDIELQPNPAIEDIIVSGLTEGKIKVYNNFGKLIFEDEYVTSDGNRKISVKQLNAGIYFVHIISEQKSTIKKLIISN